MSEETQTATRERPNRKQYTYNGKLEIKSSGVKNDGKTWLCGRLVRDKRSITVKAFDGVADHIFERELDGADVKLKGVHHLESFTPKGKSEKVRYTSLKVDFVVPPRPEGDEAPNDAETPSDGEVA